ncbi:hypothetical protein KY308_01505, partial [Candidatus Woesearchaeota archaeon]|nr:hypothetical protein [Candidatus Woesearchaeota archaeon]
MKKTIIILFVLVLMASLAIAAGPQGIHEPGTGLEQPELMNASQGTGQGAEPTLISAPVQQRLRARNYSELQLMVQERNQEMAQEMQQLSRKEQAVYQNQNKVRLAVHALLASENLTGGIGPQISAIAIQFNNSVQATIRAEERIQNRSAIARFFAGGDAEDAAEIEQQVVANRARIQQL